MAHKCFYCNVWIGDDRLVCVNCLKRRKEELLLIKPGQGDFGVRVIDKEKKSEVNVKEEE